MRNPILGIAVVLFTFTMSPAQEVVNWSAGKQDSDPATGMVSCEVVGKLKGGTVHIFAARSKSDLKKRGWVLFPFGVGRAATVYVGLDEKEFVQGIEQAQLDYPKTQALLRAKSLSIRFVDVWNHQKQFTLSMTGASDLLRKCAAIFK